MHEFSLVNNILAAAFQVASEHGDLPIESVSVEVGALRQVVPEALQFAFVASVQDTLAEGATLDWIEVPTRIACSHCGTEFAPEDLFWVCSACKAPGGRVVHGEELVLKSVTLAEPTRATGA